MARATPTPRPLRIIIDGPTGSGKTTFASQLARELGALVLHSDDWVPGWNGFERGTKVTEDLVSGARDSYTRFDWETYQNGEEVCPDVTRDWVVEGSGSLTRETRAHADITIWVETDPKKAKARALARDGEDFAPWWDTWKTQERQHESQNSPRDLADFIVTT